MVNNIILLSDKRYQV